MTDEFVKARPGTPVTVLDNVGHYPMIESPRRFADAVIATPRRIVRCVADAA